MRNYETSKFTKVIRLTQEHYDYLKSIKSKKSMAGRLEDLINKNKKV